MMDVKVLFINLFYKSSWMETLIGNFITLFGILVILLLSTEIFKEIVNQNINVMKILVYLMVISLQCSFIGFDIQGMIR